MKTTFALILGMILLTGCIPSYTAVPVTKEFDDGIEISLDLADDGIKSLPKGFVFTVRNHTDKDIEIDWNRTLYIEGGQTNGGFMFAGVVYSKREEMKRPDIVFPGGSFTKKIFPNANVYQPSVGGWEIYILGEGERGVSASFKIDGHEIRKQVTLNVVSS